MTANLSQIAAAVKQLKRLQKQEAFDPYVPESRPTPMQQSIIDEFGQISRQYVIAGNQSGKSQTGARLLTWLITDTHPKWKRPEKWGQEPMQALIVGRTTKIIEDVLWRKIEPFLEEGTYKVIRIGNTIQRVEMSNGNTMVFQSFENEDSARERVQGYSANFVWLDEMPHSFRLWDELHKRIIAKDGYFLATFTPLIQNNEIRKTVDSSQAPISRKYTFRMFDNPIYQDPSRQTAILKDMEHLPENVRETRLNGAWSVADKSVFHFAPEQMVRQPVNYSPAWRHVEWSDPATESAHGLVIAAEDPATGHWHIIRAEYLRGIHVPERIFQAVLQRTNGLNIVRRVVDPAATWYIHTASEKGVTYLAPFDKNSRKMELIKNLQTALGTRLFIAPWCQDLIDELLSCQYSEAGKIINGHRFHLLDAAQYGADLLPAFEGPKIIRTWDQELYEGNEKRKQSEKKMKIASTKRGNRRLWKVSSSGVWRFR